MIELFIIALLAGSLEELLSEVTGTQSYTEELKSYIVEHNISVDNHTFTNEELNTSFIPDRLETFVKSHMETCELTGNETVKFPFLFGTVVSGHC